MPSTIETPTSASKSKPSTLLENGHSMVAKERDSFSLVESPIKKSVENGSTTRTESDGGVNNYITSNGSSTSSTPLSNNTKNSKADSKKSVPKMVSIYFNLKRREDYLRVFNKQKNFRSLLLTPTESANP